MPLSVIILPSNILIILPSNILIILPSNILIVLPYNILLFYSWLWDQSPSSLYSQVQNYIHLSYWSDYLTISVFYRALILITILIFTLIALQYPVILILHFNMNTCDTLISHLITIIICKHRHLSGKMAA